MYRALCIPDFQILIVLQVALDLCFPAPTRGVIHKPQAHCLLKCHHMEKNHGLAPTRIRGGPGLYEYPSDLSAITQLKLKYKIPN